MTKLFIPAKIKVGFQKRNDTFTGKLAYVIYFDEKGKLRKETSWEGWRDKTIEPIEFDNTPRNNYVLNKGIQRYSDWGSGRSVIRVHDPRDFEFEISVDNLIGILMHSDVSKRDIVEECVFAWAGTELVLLPVNSVEYQESVQYTEKQSNKVSAKELKLGYTYARKKSDEKLIYIGHYAYWEYSNWRIEQIDKGKRHVFWDGSNFVIPSVGTLSHALTDEASEDFSNLVEKFQNSLCSSKIVSISTKELKTTTNDIKAYKVVSQDNVISISHYSYDKKVINTESLYVYDMSCFYGDKFYIKDKKEIQRELDRNRYYGYYHSIPIPQKTEILQAISAKGFTKTVPIDIFVEILNELGYGTLYVTTESGKTVKTKE